MSSPRTLQEALAQCRASGVDLRVSGRGMSACFELVAPFCPGGVTSDGPDGLPACIGEGLSPEKAAILLRESQARMCMAGHEPSCEALGLVRVAGPWGDAGDGGGTPWGLVAGGAAAVAGVIVFFALR